MGPESLVASWERAIKQEGGREVGRDGGVTGIGNILYYKVLFWRRVGEGVRCYGPRGRNMCDGGVNLAGPLPLIRGEKL